jgi:putative Holliday junction resolvase
MRILAVDPGDRRIGLAISDETGTIANPLSIFKHVSRPIDAATIVQVANESSVDQIVVGQALDDEGQPTSQGRLALRLAQAIRQQTHIPIVLWDESGSTRTARDASIAMGESAKVRRRRGHGHLDDLAATVILQSYIDYLRFHQ